MRFWQKFSIPIYIALFSKFYILLVIPYLSSFLDKSSRANYLSVFEAWNIWDSPHYISIAQVGYKTSGDEANFIAFFPLFPFLIRVTQIVFLGNTLLASFFLATCFSLLLACLFYKFVLDNYSKTIALFSVLTLFIFPTSLFLHIPYTESLFLSVVLAAFICLDKKWILPALVLSGLATLTRTQGLALAGAVFVEIWVNHKDYLKKNFLGIPLMFLTGIAGFIIYLGFNYFIYGNLFQFAQVQKDNWNNSFDILGKGLKSSIESFFWREGPEKYMLSLAQLGAFLLGFLGTAYSFFYLKKSIATYCLIIFLMIFTSSFWLSTPRYILVLFPLFIILGKLSRRKLFIYVWISLSIILLTVFSLLAIDYGPVF